MKEYMFCGVNRNVWQLPCGPISGDFEALGTNWQLRMVWGGVMLAQNMEGKWGALMNCEDGYKLFEVQVGKTKSALIEVDRESGVVIFMGSE